MRIRFIKTGRARYISHLDLMATIQRALLRTGIELSYSQGFNPHPYISAALPLPVGCASLCELLDFESAYNLLPDGLPELITSALPEGIVVTEVYSPARKFSDIAWLEICGELHYGSESLPRAADRLTAIFSAESIVILKKTKSGESNVDIAPFIRAAAFSRNGDVIEMRATVSAQNPTITPSNLLKAIAAADNAPVPDLATFTRRELFDKTIERFF